MKLSERAGRKAKRAGALLARKFIWLYRLPPIDKFTGVLCIIGALQLWAFVQSERAAVVLLAINVTSSGNATPFGIRLEFKNGGKSTALGEVALFFKIGELSEQPDYAGGFVSRIAPIISGGAITHNFSVGLDPAEIGDIRTGKLPFYVYGYVSYRDAFSLFGSKITGFCAAFDPHGIASVSVFSTCKKQNYSYAS